MAKSTPNIDAITEAYVRLAGNKAAVARELGMDVGTVRKRLSEAGVDRPVVGGRKSHIDYVDHKLPTKGEIKRYIVTSVQNNTHVHKKFWKNLSAYAEWLDAEILICAFSYNKGAYMQRNSLLPGRNATLEDRQETWFDPMIEPYICNLGPEGTRGHRLANGLLLCGEIDQLPTAAEPLSGMDPYGQGASCIFPHSSRALKSVATMKGEQAKMMYTTGTVTLQNYVPKKTGMKAQFHHVYGAVVVEVLHTGAWWVRQISGDKTTGSFFDCPSGTDGLIQMVDGQAYDGGTALALNCGDVHASEMDPDVAHSLWAKDGHSGDKSIIDALKPDYQFLHDLFSMRSRSHHDEKVPSKKLEKWARAEHSGEKESDRVEDEVRVTFDIMKMAHRPDTEMVVVHSNHDRHGDTWVEFANHRNDPANAEYLLEAQLAQTKHILTQSKRKKPEAWQFHEWALTRAGCDFATFLKRDGSFVIAGNIECGMHGDEGPNGSRGSTRSYRNISRRVNKGHDHTAAIMNNVYSAGACASSFSYQHGPSSHSVSHIVTYPDGKRAILTYHDGKWRA